MTLGNRLREARKRSGFTQKQLAQKIGAKHNSVSNWENGLNMPDPITIEKICSVLDTTPNFLLMDDEIFVSTSNTGLIGTELELLKKYRRLDRFAKGAVDVLLDYYYGLDDIETSEPPLTIKEMVPETRRLQLAVISDIKVINGFISSQSVSAGSGTHLDADTFENICVQENDLTRRAAFYVPVSGNSMEPKYYDEDILIIEQSPVGYGEIGIFTLDGQGYVKKRGKTELISLNPAYDPIPMNDDIVCNGKVIGVLASEWLIDK